MDGIIAEPHWRDVSSKWRDEQDDVGQRMEKSRTGGCGPADSVLVTLPPKTSPDVMLVHLEFEGGRYEQEAVYG